MGKRHFMYEDVVIASLLHDIGKFIQRADKKKYKRDEMEGQLCKLAYNSNYYTHKHVLFTLGFLENVYDTFPADYNNRDIARLAAFHHNPSHPVEQLISRADCISSGQDRRSDKELESEFKQAYYKTPALSGLWNVTFSNEKLNEQAFKLPLAKLSPEVFIPDQSVEVNRKKYTDLWEQFERDFLSLKNTNSKSFVAALDSLLEQYTWCIPSTTIDSPDISLYDHSITTAAFASVLYKFHEYYDSLDSSDDIVNRDEKKYAFLNGDVSGIQKYIFNLKTTDNSAKLLRAKSFEIQYIVESFINSLLSSLDLPGFCALFKGGGRFLLVLPNTDNTYEIVTKFRSSCDEYFLKNYFGEISLNLSELVYASENDLKGENSKILFNKLSYVSRKAKQKKFQYALKNPNDHIIDYEYNKIVHGCEVCAYCGIRATKPSKEYCIKCDELIHLGTELPKSKYVVFNKVKILKENIDLNLNNVKLFKEKDHINFDEVYYSINKFEPGLPLYRMPYHIPSDHSSEEGIKKILTFKELSIRSRGAKKIAMFKADLDNLGAIFSFGMGDRISISRNAALSRTLDYFFSTYLNYEICNNKIDKFKNIYTVYSGGDDLCLIGPWDIIIDFAFYIRDKFSKFTGSNNYISISGGIVLSGCKVPVSSIADNAEHALEKSKSKEGKNSISFFNTTVKWEKGSQLLIDGQKLIKLLFADNVDNNDSEKSFGLIYRLFHYHKRWSNFKEGGNIDVRNALWKSNFAYDCTRNLKNLNESEKEWFMSLADDDSIQYILIPASYALFNLRK